MGSATGSRSHTHTRWWLGALLLALLAWTAWQNEALRGRVAALEQENRSLAQALAARAVAVPQAAAPGPVAVVVAGPLTPAAVSAPDPLTAYAKPPASSPRGQGPFEEALQRLREPVSNPGTSPFGRR